MRVLQTAVHQKGGFRDSILLHHLTTVCNLADTKFLNCVHDDHDGRPAPTHAHSLIAVLYDCIDIAWHYACIFLVFFLSEERFILKHPRL